MSTAPAHADLGSGAAGVKDSAPVRACIVVPAYDAGATLDRVLDDLQRTLGLPAIVVDDGSSDSTSEIARERGAWLLAHGRNQGKGAALRTGLREAARRGFRVAVSVDADAQHPAHSARAVLHAAEDPRTLVLGVRDLERDGAPPSNRFGNGVSNFFLSLFAGRPLQDTQCGLRRYPIPETLELGARADGYAFEGEVVLRALHAGLPVVEVPIEVAYLGRAAGPSHFRNVLDPVKIVARISATLVELRARSPRRRRR